MIKKNLPLSRLAAKNLFLVILFFVSLCLCGEILADDLKYNFQPGDKFFLSTDAEIRTIETVDNNEVVTEQSTRIGNDLDILEVNENGDAFGQYTYRKAYLKLKKGTYSVTFDSEANQIRIPVDALPLGLVLGQNLYFKVAPSGFINEIKGVTALITATKAAAPLTQTRYQAMAFIDKNFNEREIRQFNEERLAIFPDSRGTKSTIIDINTLPALEKGTWRKISDINDDPPKRAEIWIFKLKEDQNGKILIDVNLTVQTAADAEELVTGGAKYKRIITGGAAGTIEIEKATGEMTQIITWDTTDEYKATAQGPVLRIPPTPPPVRTHTVSKFEIKRRSD